MLQMPTAKTIKVLLPFGVVTIYIAPLFAQGNPLACFICPPLLEFCLGRKQLSFLDTVSSNPLEDNKHHQENEISTFDPIALIEESDVETLTQVETHQSQRQSTSKPYERLLSTAEKDPSLNPPLAKNASVDEQRYFHGLLHKYLLEEYRTHAYYRYL